MLKISFEDLQLVENFGHSLRLPSYYFKLEDLAELKPVFKMAREEGLTINVRGAGRSYNDAALNAGGILLDLQRLTAYWNGNRRQD
jgi:FAD/FMN-containing dehydrogenase